MSNYIIDREETLKSLLSQEHYFQSLLEVFYSNEILDKREIEKIQMQVVDILSEIVRYYTRDESSSVRVEIAEQIMLSIYYTISVFLKSRSNMKECISLIKERPLKELYSKGEDILKEKVEKCKGILQHLIENKLETTNYSYIDTIDYGISLFFKKYDIRFASHETPGSIDYQLSNDEIKLGGVEYIETYLNRVNLENRFCSYFDPLEIENLLKSYNKNSYHMLINIYEFIITNYLGVILIGKSGRTLNITKEERAYLKSKMKNLTESELKSIFLIALERIFKELSIEDKELIDYTKETISKLIPQIKSSIDTNTLENIFISINTSEENMLRYEDGDSMDNSIFKKVTEEIRDCSKIEDKMKVIREDIHSLQDLVDVLGSDCIFDEEFIYIFMNLEDFELALLLKYLHNNEAMDGEYGTESEKEWHEKLKAYLYTLDANKKEELLRISEGIEL